MRGRAHAGARGSLAGLHAHTETACTHRGITSSGLPLESMTVAAIACLHKASASARETCRATATLLMNSSWDKSASGLFVLTATMSTRTCMAASTSGCKCNARCGGARVRTNASFTHSTRIHLQGCAAGPAVRGRSWGDPGAVSQMRCAARPPPYRRSIFHLSLPAALLAHGQFRRRLVCQRQTRHGIPRASHSTAGWFLQVASPDVYIHMLQSYTSLCKHGVTHRTGKHARPLARPREQ